MALEKQSTSQVSFLKQKTAFITGASRGIGRAAAKKFGNSGANLILHYRSNIEEIETLKSEILALNPSVHISAYSADLTDSASLEALIEKILLNHKTIDFFISNAAATAFKPLLELGPHHISKTFHLTIHTFIQLVAALNTRMPAGSKIIAVSGIDAHRYCKNHGLLGAAKAALETLVSYYAIELSKQNIFCHGINPGLVDTDSLKFYWAEDYETKKKQIADFVPEKRLSSPEDIADLLLFLSSKEANLLNGRILEADQGWSLRVPVFS